MEKAGQDKKTPSSFDINLNFISDSISAFSKDPMTRTYDFVRLYAVAIAYQLGGSILIVLVGLLLGFVFAGMAGTFNLYELITYAKEHQTTAIVFLGLFSILAIVIGFVANWYAYSTDLITYVTVEHQNKGTRVKAYEESKDMRTKAMPIFALETILGVVFTGVLIGIIMLPFLSVIDNPSTFDSNDSRSALGFILGFYLVMFVTVGIAVVVTLTYRFLTQFWKINVALGNLGWKEALASSVYLVKKNFWNVLMFNILYGIIAWIISAGIAIASMAVLFPLQIIGWVVSVLLPFLSIPVMVVIYLVQLIIAVLTMAVLAAILLPAQVAFWKHLTTSQTQVEAGKKRKSAK